MEEFLRQYGILAVYFGMWFEGETVLVIAGFLVHQGLLQRWEVFTAAVLGALTVDSLIFTAGRLSSKIPLLERWSKRNSGLQTRVTQLGASWAVYLGVRFVYGTRTPYLFFIGTRRLAWPSFIAREVVAVLFWCSAWLFFGHSLGHLLATLYDHVYKNHLAEIVLTLAVVGVGITGAILLVRRLSYRRQSRDGILDDSPPSP